MEDWKLRHQMNPQAGSMPRCIRSSSRRHVPSFSFVGRCCHIGFGQTGDSINQHSTLRTRCNVASVDQDVAVRIKRHSPSLQASGMIFDALCGQPGTAELDHAIAAVRDQMDRIQVVVTGQQSDRVDRNRSRVDSNKRLQILDRPRTASRCRPPSFPDREHPLVAVSTRGGTSVVIGSSSMVDW